MQTMKKFYILLLLLPVLAWSCGDDEEDVLPNQQKKIISFLTSSHSPRLVAEKEVEQDSDQPFYTDLGGSAFRYIDQYYNPDRVNWKEVTAESKITITFSQYLFNYRAITDRDLPFFSNDPDWEEILLKEGLTPGVWTFEPMEVDMAHPNVLNGLYQALLGCREGDIAEVYMCYNMAYGDDDNFGLIPKESPVAVFFTINSVE